MRRHRMPRLALLAALVLCVAQLVADAHPHLDGHESEGACAICGISDPGYILDAGGADRESRAWCRTDNVPVPSATLSLRRFEVSRSRAPPIFVS